MYHAAPNTFFEHMSSQPASVNLETLRNMHQCQQTSLGKIILLPCKGLSQFSASLWICLPVTTLIIAMGGSYFLKGGFVKRGVLENPLNPPWLRACTRYSIGALLLVALFVRSACKCHGAIAWCYYVVLLLHGAIRFSSTWFRRGKQPSF